MLTFSLLSVFLNAFQYLDHNLSVIDTDTENFFFMLFETRLPLLGFADVLGSFLLVFKNVNIPQIAVVFLLKIGGADILGGLNVSATTLQHLDIIHPHLRVIDLVAITVGYLNSVPIGVDVSLVGGPET